MRWNADFEIAAVFFEAMFIIFFFAKKHLPTKQNFYFAFSMVLACVMTLFDMLSALVDSYWKLFPLALLHTVNVIFFMFASALTLSLFMYVLALTKQLEVTKTPLFAVYCIPFVVTELLALATPFLGFFYYIDEQDGYCHGPCYMLEFVLNMFYLLLVLLYVIVYRKNIGKLQRNSIFVFIFMLAAGAVLQSVFFNWVLLTNAMTCFALAVVYLSLQNPDMYIDRITGLFNQDAFQELTQETIDDGRPFAFMGICIDNLRAMYSLYGTESVNRALKLAMEYIKSEYPHSYVFRFSNDRFTVLDHECMDFTEFTEKLQERFRSPWISENQQIIFSPCMVHLPYWQSGRSVKDISNILEFAMGDVVKQGSGSTLVIDDAITGRMKRDFAVESAIEKAIEKKSMQVYYQPLYSGVDRKINSAEALARLFDDEVGFIPPEEFIIKAEQNGSIVPLGRQIFEKICTFMRDNDMEKYGIRKIGVNLSNVQCMQEELADELIDIAASCSVPMSKFDFEITETATVVSQKKIVKQNMVKLIDAGAAFSLDDYGIGYSNLVNILKLPFEHVKIDRSLVWTYFEDENNILPDVMEMFRNQKLGIVVSGVETKVMAEKLIIMGCDRLQGFYYAKPLPSQDFLRYLREKNAETVDTELNM